VIRRYGSKASISIAWTAELDAILKTQHRGAAWAEPAPVLSWIVRSATLLGESGGRVATGAAELIVNQLAMNAAYLSANFGLGGSPSSLLGALSTSRAGRN